MQSSGTLAELSLEGILETVQKDRATGTLNIHGAGGQATLYFLFGHLFHAVDGGDEQGEPVVYRALGWHDGEFTFDAKAKLPAEETIKVSTAELLANRPPSSDAETAPEAGAETAADDPEAQPVAEAEEMPAAVEETPSMADTEVVVTVAAEGEAPESVPEPRPVSLPAAEMEGAPKRRRTDQRPGTRPPETMVLYPVPVGETIHEGLTAGFVDFPKVLRSLAKDQHSGYVRLSGDGFVGVLLFSNGAVVEALYDGDGQVNTGTAAFHAFGDRIDEGEGKLDVIRLSPEMVTGIYQLLTAPSVYEKLLGRFIKADALLDHLAEQKTSGAVVVRLGGNTGVVLYREGELLGAYTDSARDVSSSAEKVVALAEDAAAEIEVRGGPVPATLPVMEPEEGGPREVPAASTAVNTPGTAVEAPPVEAAAAGEEQPPAAEAAAAGEAEATGEATAEGAELAEAAEVADVDWGAAINQMATRADAVLGTRSKKVKELLFASNHNRADMDSTIDRIAELSIMFVDPGKLSSLADEFRQIADRAA